MGCTEQGLAVLLRAPEGDSEMEGGSGAAERWALPQCSLAARGAASAPWLPGCTGYMNGWLLG